MTALETQCGGWLYGKKTGRREEENVYPGNLEEGVRGNSEWHDRLGFASQVSDNAPAAIFLFEVMDLFIPTVQRECVTLYLLMFPIRRLCRSLPQSTYCPVLRPE